MPARLINFFWLVLLLLSMVLAGGWLAESLLRLDQQNTTNWRLELQQANNEKSAKITQWLAAQTSIAKEIGSDLRIQSLLEKAAAVASSSDILLPDQEAAEALHDIAKLKYGLSHSYVFMMDGSLALKQDSARDLPLKIRETLALAYQTGLDRYLFIAFFNNKKWFFGSSRIEKGGRSLGYVMYMVEVDVAMTPLKTEGFRWRFVDFYLARRSGDDGVFLTDLNQGNANLFRLAQLELPLFKGVADAFGVYKFPNGRHYMVLTTSIPGYPFWQHMSAISTDVANKKVAEARLYYIGGAAAFFLFLLGLAYSLFRRVLNPARPIAPQFITRILNQRPHSAFGVGGAQTATARTTNQGVAPPVAAHPAPAATPKGLFGRIKTAFTGKGRTLTEEEKQKIREDSQKPDLKSKAKAADEQTIVAETEPEDAPTPKAAAKPAAATKTPEELRKEKEAKREQQQIKQIHRCLENERYRLFFQPILETHSKDKVMFETLLRLVDDDGELMQPNQFIPLALKHGFIDQVDDMVIVASLRRHMEILTQGKNMMLSINLSYGAFRSATFRDTYQEGLQGGKLKPNLLNFELSSKEIIEDDAAMRFVRDMQTSGCKFSVDYFGSVAAVQAAKKLKFDYMKINCLRFDGLGEGDAKAVAEFREVIMAGKELGLPMIAEKVENKAVLWLCEKLGVPYVQGFYLAEPSPKLALGW